MNFFINNKCLQLFEQMDGINSCNVDSNSNECESTSLPDVMAGIEMLSVDTDVIPQRKMSLRKRVRREVSESSNLNRRCSLTPKKRSRSEMESEDEIKEYYLDKTIKKHSSALETIYEEKDELQENQIYMGAKRMKRMIEFNSKVSDSKLKKRKAKVKKIFGTRLAFRKKNRRDTMQILLDKLSAIKSESSLTINNEINLT